MINLIKRQKAGELTIINLFNVDYQAKEDDIRQLYKDVNIQTITELKAGLFLVELEPEEAIKLVEIGATVSFIPSPGCIVSIWCILMHMSILSYPIHFFYGVV